MPVLLVLLPPLTIFVVVLRFAAGGNWWVKASTVTMPYKVRDRAFYCAGEGLDLVPRANSASPFAPHII